MRRVYDYSREMAERCRFRAEALVTINPDAARNFDAAAQVWARVAIMNAREQPDAAVEK